MTALEFGKQLGLIMFLPALRKQIVWGDTNEKINSDVWLSIDLYLFTSYVDTPQKM
jgi:hypothetical protein